MAFPGFHRGWFTSFHGSALHLHVNLDITVSRIYVGMPQPSLDDTYVISRLEQMQSSRVTECVWADGFGLHCRTCLCGVGRILTHEIANSKTRDPPAVGIDKNRGFLGRTGMPKRKVVFEG